jgi:AcrR family transcriptional regulator
MSSRPRGRPRSFDEDAVLAAVSDTFWQRGFSGCSLDDLAQAAGVTRPSLYVALGDKRSMYLRALERFEAELQAGLAACLEAKTPLRQGLLRFYRSSIELYCSGDAGPRGCLVVCTAPVEALHDVDVRALLAQVLAAMDKGFEARFEEALRDGEIAPDADVSARARVASSVVHSLAIRARAGATKEVLNGLAEAGAMLASAF